MIQLDQPYILASTQTFECVNFNMTKLDGQWSCSITMNIKDQNGNFVKSETLRVQPSQWNSFWQNFNTGTYLYDYVATQKNLGVQPSSDSENDFVNS